MVFLLGVRGGQSAAAQVPSAVISAPATAVPKPQSNKICCWSCRYGATSRYWACTSLKSEITYARAMAVASGLLRPSTLPRSCAGLKRPDQLPFVWEQWSVSWTDMPLRHRQSGLVRLVQPMLFHVRLVARTVLTTHVSHCHKHGVTTL